MPARSYTERLYSLKSMNTERTPDWVWVMHQSVWKYALPLLFGLPPRQGEAPNLHGASSVAVQLQGAQFVISARHVVLPALEACERAQAECQIGPVRLKLNEKMVSLGSGFSDLATVQITSRHIEVLEAEGHQIVRPAQWPPPEPVMQDPVLAFGYPGNWRLPIIPDAIDVRVASFLALIEQLTPETFTCQLDPAFVDQRQVGAEELPADHLPGMSGGPGFLVRHERVPVLTPSSVAFSR
jgi:hypothetical protein